MAFVVSLGPKVQRYKLESVEAAVLGRKRDSKGRRGCEAQMVDLKRATVDVTRDEHGLKSSLSGVQDQFARVRFVVRSCISSFFSSSVLRFFVR